MLRRQELRAARGDRGEAHQVQEKPDVGGDTELARTVRCVSLRPDGGVG